MAAPLILTEVAVEEALILTVAAEEASPVADPLAENQEVAVRDEHREGFIRLRIKKS